MILSRETLARIRDRMPRQQTTAPKPKRRKQPSPLEGKFDNLWTLLKGPPLEREVKLLAPRQHRFDRVHRASLVVVEIHGGTFSGGRHTRGRGFADDRWKMTEAQKLGYLVFELTESEINSTKVKEIIGEIQRRPLQLLAGKREAGK